MMMVKLCEPVKPTPAGRFDDPENYKIGVSYAKSSQKHDRMFIEGGPTYGEWLKERNLIDENKYVGDSDDEEDTEDAVETNAIDNKVNTWNTLNTSRMLRNQSTYDKFLIEQF